MFARAAWLVLKKDLAIEARSWEIVITTLFFALSAVVVFMFAFVRDGQPIPGAASGILWISLAFAGTLALGRTFERERQGETLRGLLLAPASRAAIFTGKLLGIVLLLLAVELLLVPLVMVLFQEHHLLDRWPLLAVLLVAGAVGFAAVGTLFAAMLVRVRTRDVLLPILLYPITIPALVAGVSGTQALMETPPAEPLAVMWIAILVCYDVVFMTLALWVFEPLMTE
jgi:heme exporter protein B